MDGSWGILNTDPIQRLPYEMDEEPHPPDTTKQVVQRVTLQGAKVSAYRSLTAEVVRASAIVPYQLKDGSLRVGRPFSVVWAFYSSP